MGYYITLYTVHTTQGWGQEQETIATAHKQSLGQGNVLHVSVVLFTGGVYIPACTWAG